MADKNAGQLTIRKVRGTIGCRLPVRYGVITPYGAINVMTTLFPQLAIRKPATGNYFSERLNRFEDPLRQRSAAEEHTYAKYFLIIP